MLAFHVVIEYMCVAGRAVCWTVTDQSAASVNVCVCVLLSVSVCVCLCIPACVCVCSYNYELVFGVNIHGLTKSDRLIYGESLMTHAMVLTAVHEEVLSLSVSLVVCHGSFQLSNEHQFATCHAISIIIIIIIIIMRTFV